VNFDANSQDQTFSLRFHYGLPLLPNQTQIQEQVTAGVGALDLDKTKGAVQTAITYKDQLGASGSRIGVDLELKRTATPDAGRTESFGAGLRVLF
jgi:hypothetical protein